MLMLWTTHLAGFTEVCATSLAKRTPEPGVPVTAFDPENIAERYWEVVHSDGS